MSERTTGFVKIEVVRCDGGSEILTLTEPLKISGNCIVTGTGCEHFFREDGRYDGWGMPFSASVPDGSDPMEEVLPFIEAIDRDREITPPETTHE